MKSSLEPEDLRILNRNTAGNGLLSGYPRLSIKSDKNCCSPIKEEENDVIVGEVMEDGDGDGENSNPVIEEVVTIKKLNLNESRVERDKEVSEIDTAFLEDEVETDATEERTRHLGAKLFMRKLDTRVFNETAGCLNGYESKFNPLFKEVSCSKIKQIIQSLISIIFLVICTPKKGKDSLSNFGVRSIKWDSYIESWKNLADKYNRISSKQLDKIAPEAEPVIAKPVHHHNLQPQPYESIRESRLVAKVLNSKLNIKNSVYKGKKNKPTRSFTESTDEISSNSQKVTNNPIYIPESRLR